MSIFSDFVEQDEGWVKGWVKKIGTVKLCIGYHVQTENKNDFLSLDFGLTEFNVLGSKERFRRYRRFLYEKGAKESGIDEKSVQKECKKDFQLGKINRFRHRTRYFTDSGIIGTKDFVFVTYLKFKHFFQTKHDKIPKCITGLDGIYSMKRLAESRMNL